ncbi:MAG: type II toxin-antitoxin system RelE/ParE family toxin [Spirochaetaceae bacterium]|nr:type II toxin-antitoxin system RelE/ParE family toxin [Spirochaetaceae bacterium]
MRIFKNQWFSRFVEKEGIFDDELKDAVRLLEAGRSDADLGGGVYKLRLARFGGGKSGGYRVIVFFKSGKRAFFVYGFAKSNRDNISVKQLKGFKLAARVAFSYNEEQLHERLMDYIRRFIHETV